MDEDTADPKDASYKADDIILLNVGGTRHETTWATLQRFPGSKLSDHSNLKTYYRPGKQEYYFDRSPRLFEHILNYYRVGELHKDRSICARDMALELAFWGIKAECLESCCWLDFRSQCNVHQTIRAMEEHTLEQRRLNRHDGLNTCGCCMVTRGCRARCWMLLNEPFSSKLAMAHAILSMSVMLLSIGTLCASTAPSLKVNLTVDESEPVAAPHPILLLLDYACYMYFMLELTVSIICCPSPRRFFSSFVNIIDTISVILFVVELAINHTNVVEARKVSILDALFALRVLRVFRVFRMAKHHDGLEVLECTLKASIKEILLLLLFLFIGVLVFGSIIYCTDHDSKFTSIGTSFWWAIVTMTTVGYGDMVPTSDLGKVVGALCAVSGVMLIGFTVPIVVNNFLLFYTQVKYGKRVEWLEKLHDHPRKERNDATTEEASCKFATAL